MQTDFETPATLDDLYEWLSEREFNETIVLENPAYLSAIVGITNEGQLCYHYDLMAQDLVKEDGMTLEEAYEFIDYNTIRALPYMGAMAPIVIMPLNGV